ncbi:unnamed protein product [Pedinophyceae sp. YPF-701]|nr:unnamed protein product [Pedinophyceae sp. YPF-701]
MARCVGDKNKYQLMETIGAGQFGVTQKALDTATGTVVAVKMIPRGDRIDKNTAREVLNHRRLLKHRNIVEFREVFLTPQHLCIAMEYAAGGEIFAQLAKRGRLDERTARALFAQLVAGVRYSHSLGICHRDLKLENVLLSGPLSASAPPAVKICDFGYSKSYVDDSQPATCVGTPAYIAPEVLQRRPYDGPLADVWSLGCCLYTMVAGQYPFQDARHPEDNMRMVLNILGSKFSTPVDALPGVSPDCKCALWSSPA